MKTVACIIARTNSTRLPKKVLKKIGNKMMIEHIIDRIKLCKNIDIIYVCSSTHPDDLVLKNSNVKFYAGSEESVIDRMLDVAKIEKADNVIRITGDNVFTDSVYLDIMIEKHIEGNYEYTRAEYLPVGLTAEVIDAKALKKCYETMNPNESQYLLVYMFQPENYKCLVLIPSKRHIHPDWSLTVDTPLDWERTEQIFSFLGNNFSYDDIVNLQEDKSIKNLYYGSGSLVKLPANMVLYFDSFRKEMDMRIEHSSKEHIVLEKYNEVLNEQKI